MSFAATQAGRAADPVAYTVDIAPTGVDELDAAVDGVSLLKTLGESAPVGPAALVARAHADGQRFTAAMHSLGHYGGTVAIRIDGEPADSLDLVDRLDALPQGSTVPIEITLAPGPVFPLRHVAVLGDVPARIRQDFALAPGMPARAREILAAGSALRDTLRAEGYALAQVDAPDAVLDPAAQAVDVTFQVRPGPLVDIGAIQLAGLERLDPEYLRRRLLLREGERFDSARLAAARRDLAALPVLSGARIIEGEALDAQGRLPITVQVVERKRRQVDVAAAWSTDEGGKVSVGWTHRNLFGSAEQLTLSAAATELGGSATRAPGYNLDAMLVLPDFYVRDQSLTLDVNAQRADLRAYTRTAIRASATLRRKVAENWWGTVGLAAQQARITQEGQVFDYTLLQVPLSLALDTTTDLLDPRSGIKARLSVTPTMNLGNTGARQFAIAQASGSIYFDVGNWFGAEEGRSVLALRALVGMIVGGAVLDLPPDQRFYAGGSTTIRGYRFQSVGPLFPSGRPRGGNAINAAGIEFRQRFGESWGAAAFIDAGQISTGGVPFTGDVRVGAGVGVRYYTGIGPVRVDVAVPLVRQRKTEAVQFYIGIGQSF